MLHDTPSPPVEADDVPNDKKQDIGGVQCYVIGNEDNKSYYGYL